MAKVVHRQDKLYIPSAVTCTLISNDFLEVTCMKGFSAAGRGVNCTSIFEPETTAHSTWSDAQTL